MQIENIERETKMSKEIAAQSVSDIERMANAIAKSGLFGMKKPEEAMALMLIAQAEGQHPALAARDYHIIQGKPALKADAMLARFQAAGGKVNWKHLGDEAVSAEFTHSAGGTALIEWTMDMAKRAGFAGKDNWKKFPRAMLRARVISEGIRTVFPGVVIGVYTPEEVQDFDDKPQPPAGKGPIVEGNVQEVPVDVGGSNFSMAIDREQAEQVHEQALKKIAACDNLDSLKNTWRGYAKTLKSLPEDLAADLIQKKDECKAELEAQVGGTIMDAG